MGKGQHGSEIERGVALDARDWIVRLTAGNVSRQDLDRFHAWRAQSPEHARAFAREKEFWQLLRDVDGSGLDAAPVSTPKLSRSVSRRTFLVGAAVAASAAALAAPRIMTWMRSDFATGAGEQATAALPDGSTMLLNTNSAVDVDFQPGLRLVNLLAGEVEFSIRPDAGAPFRVAALGGNSDANEGIHAVRSIADEVTVTASSGAIAVSGGRAANKVSLTAGQQTRYRSGEAPMAATDVNVANELAWRGGRVVFEGRPFGSAVGELGRYIPERLVIATHTHDASPVSAVFLTRDAHDAIEALAQTQGLTVRRVPGIVIVIS
ncbi:FecR domain-containing protein [Aminobacter anthyllidis]|uniref:FecR family protein n=1 Tax=Aminobacter anthyllidis TaxID=1035067 RepID=UPI0024541E5C|nr:FecR domain-containing protein [Aminobacter anthyllidis]MDH4986537.1 FecR domain-containing protein [Aminobacter anthyllidis]